MPFYTGVFNVNANPAELNQRSFASHILRKYPDGSAPIFALTSQTGRSKAKSATHGYFTKTLTFPSVTVTGAQGSGITALPVGSSADIQDGMMLLNPVTKENMRVSGTPPNATTVNVVRGFGRVAAAAISAAQVLVVIGTAFAEGSARPVSRGLTTVYVPNFTEIFRNAWAVTDTARASYVEAGMGNIAESKRDGMMLHSVDIESAILFGQAKMDVTGAQPIHTTQGIIDATTQYAPANVNTAAGTTNYLQFIALQEPAFAFSHDLAETKSRTLFGGQLAISVINELARRSGVVQIQDGQTNFGLHFTRFTFYKGTIYLIEHPIMNGIPGMSGLAVTVDMPALKLAYMDGRDTRVESYGGANMDNNASGVDADGGSFTSELAVELMNPTGCSVIYGLTAGAATP